MDGRRTPLSPQPALLLLTVPAFPSCQLEVFPSEPHLKPCSSCPLASQVMAQRACIKQRGRRCGPSASSCRQNNPLSAKRGAAKAFQFQHLMGNGKTSPPSPFPYLDSLNPQVATCQHNAALLLLKDSAPSRTCAHTFTSPQRLAGSRGSRGIQPRQSQVCSGHKPPTHRRGSNSLKPSWPSWHPTCLTKMPSRELYFFAIFLSCNYLITSRPYNFLSYQLLPSKLHVFSGEWCSLFFLCLYISLLSRETFQEVKLHPLKM